LGLVEALVAHGAKVTAVARGAEALDAVHARLGVATVSGDVTDGAAAHRVLAEFCPDILVLNAGVTPPMGSLEPFRSPQGAPLPSAPPWRRQRFLPFAAGF
jgi:NADP-dependent 3-hydroxy acid dehydrogenase YdfG